MRSVVPLLLCLSAFLSASNAFVVAPHRRPTTRILASATNQEEVSFLLKEFACYNGEIVDPYDTLQVPRQADTSDIKQAYRALCRHYHPDATRYNDDKKKDDETLRREQWERITWSYTLLSSRSQRRKYDRHYAWAQDPGKAIAEAAWAGVSSMARGFWTMGSMAVAKAMELHYEQQQQQQQQEQALPVTFPFMEDDTTTDQHPLVAFMSRGLQAWKKKMRVVLVPVMEEVRDKVLKAYLEPRPSH